MGLWSYGSAVKGVCMVWHPGWLVSEDSNLPTGCNTEQIGTICSHILLVLTTFFIALSLLVATRNSKCTSCSPTSPEEGPVWTQGSWFIQLASPWELQELLPCTTSQSRRGHIVPIRCSGHGGLRWGRSTECDHVATQALPALFFAQERTDGYLSESINVGLKSIKLEITTLLKQYRAHFALRITWGISSCLQTPAPHAPADTPLFPHVSLGSHVAPSASSEQMTSDSQFNIIFL